MIPRLPVSLRYRKYRLLWLGLIVSIAGSRMQTAAVLWHINELSGQPIALGMVGLVTILPVLLFSLFAGTIADAFNRRRVMFATQSALALLAGLLGWVTLQGHASLAWVYAIVASSAAIWTFDLPARQALVPNLVDPAVLTNAFSMNAVAFQAGAIAGPALAGFVLAKANPGVAYLVNAATYLAVILALWRMGPVPQETAAGPRGLAALRGTNVVPAIKEGLRFVLQQPIILSSMLLDFLATFFSSANTLLPIFATRILQVGPVGYGWLVAASSVGAGLVSFGLSFVPTIRHQGRVLLLSVAGFGLATLTFGLSRNFALSFLALAATGAADAVSMIIRNTIRQLQTPDRLRGRMTSINQMFFMGGPQLGEVEAGVVAQVLGAPLAVITGGIGCLLGLIWIDRRFPQLRAFEGDEPIRAGAAPEPQATMPAGD